jgi:hypothetical protein
VQDFPGQPGCHSALNFLQKFGDVSKMIQVTTTTLNVI